MSSSKPAPLVIHGWMVFSHPVFLGQLETLAQQVEAFKQKDPLGYVKKNASKRLTAITKLAFDIIPQDPTRPEYRQGKTLGDNYQHWFRAKFFQQYHLFFRYHTSSKVIVLAWVNDDNTKRAYERSDDAYRVFGKMLESGHPPDDWDALLAEACAGGKISNGVPLASHHKLELGAEQPPQNRGDSLWQEQWPASDTSSTDECLPQQGNRMNAAVVTSRTRTPLSPRGRGRQPHGIHAIALPSPVKQLHKRQRHSTLGVLLFSCFPFPSPVPRIIHERHHCFRARQPGPQGRDPR
ncbi:MAG: type II toxin-antitoxin system YhaV family toxin [Thauera sp.]|jgi:toxin YhaV|nr:type II toxin-antitoxin system YhaV family toxin [Thauera sp.]